MYLDNKKNMQILSFNNIYLFFYLNNLQSVFDYTISEKYDWPNTYDGTLW